MQFTTDWFEFSEIKKILTTNPINTDIPLNMLEIGCYEGSSTCWFAENLLTHQNSRLYCVDPFTDDPCVEITDDVYERFKKNISLCKNNEKIIFSRMTSDQYFKNAPKNFFDIIYIDGCHTPEVVTRDLKNSIECVKLNKYIFIDDYDSGLKEAINKVYYEEKHRLKIIHCRYQILFQRIF